MPKVIERVCSHCEELMGCYVDGQQYTCEDCKFSESVCLVGEAEGTSHGICQTCLELAEMEFADGD